MSKAPKSAEMVNGEWDECYTLFINSRNDLGTFSSFGGATVQFGANAVEMGPFDMMGRGGGPARQVAENRRNGDVDAHGAGGRRSGSFEVNADVERAFGGVVWQAAGRFKLHIVFRADKTRKWAQELSDGIDGVPDVVVERALMEATRKEVVAAGVALFLAVAAGWRGGLIEEREAELSAQEESVCVRMEAVVREPPGQGMEGDAGGLR